MISEDIKNPEIEKVELPTPPPTNEGTGNKNYHFHNCAITINEEGKAIDVLAAKQKAEADKEAKQMEITSVIVTEITKVFSKVTEAFIKPQPKPRSAKPVPEPIFPGMAKKAAPKKAPAKKAPAKKSVRKK